MATVALLNEYVTINASNLSDHVKVAKLLVDSAQLDPTAMGDNWKEVQGGLKSGSLQLELNEDVAAGSIDAILWPLLGTVVAFEVRIDAGAVSTSNPKYTGSVFIGHHELGGTLGELGKKTMTIPTSGTITRATA